MTEELIAKQYSQHVYPHPIQDLKDHAKAGGISVGEPRLYSPIIWPYLEKIPESGNILVAGCGTHQAAYYAFTYPEWSVVGIDLSESSLAHQQYLKERHKLDNLELKRKSLLEFSSDSANFDFVVCTGVLHHLVDPVAGLKALSAVLDEKGVALIMVYGAALRVGVYMLQEAFKKLSTSDQSASDIKLVRDTLKSLPPKHAVCRYLNSTSELKFDAAIVDTFLNPQDQAYDVEGVMQLIEKSGMQFHSWVDRGRYTAKIFYDQSHPIYARVASLQEIERFSVAEKLNQNLGTHFFYCSKPDLTIPDLTGILSTARFVDLVPIRSYGIESFGQDSTGRYKYSKDKREFSVSPAINDLFVACTNANTKSIGELISASLALQNLDIDHIRTFFETQHEFGNIMFKCHRFT